jgi:DNA-binding NtrC family response regulator
MPLVLVVDDEPGVQESLRMLLKEDCQVITAGSAAEALVAVEQTPPDLVLLDLVMPGRSGLDLLSDLSERGVPAPVIVLTATKTVTTAVEAMKRGAADYVTKPFEVDALRIKIRRLLEQGALEREVARLRDEVSRRDRLGDMVGRSAPMQELFRAIERVARSKASVLIRGDPRHAAGERALRPRARRLHRCPRAAHRALRGRQRRNPLPGRGG